MSVLPVGLRAESLTVLVVGGGTVGARKARAFLEAGARVRVVAPAVDPELRALRASALELHLREFDEADLDDADLAVAATGDPAVNARVAAACRARRRLCNRVDEPGSGTFDTLAVHRAGGLAIGVSASGVPGAAARIRDEIAVRFDARYGDAVDQVARLRTALRPSGRWTGAADQVLADFCETVENGTLGQRLSQWD